LYTIYDLTGYQEVAMAARVTWHRGSALTRPPRLPLDGTERQEVEAIVRNALANRPTLPVRYKAA
jgi:hypothetical protein